MDNKNSNTSQAPEIHGNFVAFLAGKNEGVTTHELDNELAALVREVNETGRSGKLTYTIELSKKNKRGIIVTDDLKVTKPKRQKETSFLFADATGRLLRNDPETVNRLA